ncbi:MAG: radical SAM protein [Acidobacteriota bacterium]
MGWRDLVINTAAKNSLLWAGLRALHPPYTVARCRWRRRPTLRWVQIEVTNHCNLACTMCSNPLSQRPRGLMSREVFHEALRQIPDGSLHRLGLISLGEPLLHPDLELFASCARPKAREVFTSTNGLLLGRDTALMRRLLAAGPLG